MEMTIDEAIKELELALANNTIEDVESAFKYILAIHLAIDTMRKYQKIEQIVRWNNAPSPYYKPDGQLFREIIEVLEDENN